MNETLQQAISLARSGQTPAAADLLHGLVEREPNNGEAWLWLAGLTADPRERLNALNRVVQIDPGNGRAQQGLEALRQQHPELFPAAAAATVPQFFDSPAPSFTPTPVAGAAASPTSAAPTSLARGDIYSGVTQPFSTQAGAGSVTPATPARAAARASIYDAPTVSQPVITALPVESPAPERRLVGVAPAVSTPRATAQMPAAVVAPPHRNPVAFVARVLLTLLWLVLTALLVLTAALALRYSQQAVNVSIGLPQVLRNSTGISSLSGAGSSLQGIGIATGVLGVLGAIITLGMVLRWRIALILSLVVGFLIAVVGVITGVIAYVGGEDITGVGGLLGLSDKIGGIVAGILLLWPLLLAFIAWSEFSRRRPTT